MDVHDPSALHDAGTGTGPPAHRRRAAAAAGHLGDEATARNALEDEDPAVRATGFAALVRLEAATLGDLERAATDASAVVRRRAAELAWRTGLPAEDLQPMIATLLGDGEAGVVEAACYCIGELGDPGSALALEAVASAHPDPLCRESAVAALGAIGNAGSLAVILKALGDRPAVRRRAVLALAAYEGGEVDAALAAALEDRDWQVRQAAEDLTSPRRPGR